MKKMPTNKELKIRPTKKDHQKARRLIKKVLEMAPVVRKATIICPPGMHPEVGSYLKMSLEELGGPCVFKVIAYLGNNEFSMEEDLTALTGAALLLQQGAA